MTAASGRRKEATSMSKKKAPKKSAPKKAPKPRKEDPVVATRPFDTREVPLEPRKAKAPAGEKAAPKEKAPREDLVVFAFRLTEAERDAIHKAAGPAKASGFVRRLAVAAARGDEAAVAAILKAVASPTA
jgi:hypothetical protein